jgi:hypothetical protein
MPLLRPCRRGLLVLSAALLVGCQQESVWMTPGSISLERDGHRPRSLVMDSPGLTSLQDGHADAELPWYADRLDYPLSTTAGYESQAYEVSATRTIDRRHESRGRVYDSSTQTTYRYRLQRQVD